MYLLHIETSTSLCSTALSTDGDLLGSASASGMQHGAMLAPLISQVLGEHDVQMKNLGAVVVSMGPGSYTGLRVGIATAKAIAYSLQIPLIPVSTLYMLADAAQRDADDAGGLILPMIDARRMEVYCSLFDAHLDRLWPEEAVILEEGFVARLKSTGRRIVACGDGAMKLKSLPVGLDMISIREDINCEARHLIGPGLAAMRSGQYGDVFHVTPSYVKAPNITTPKKAAGH